MARSRLKSAKKLELEFLHQLQLVTPTLQRALASGHLILNSSYEFQKAQFMRIYRIKFRYSKAIDNIVGLFASPQSTS